MVKDGVEPRTFEWYPYDSFACLPLFGPLLSRAQGGLLELIGSEYVADIGCADGDLAFFLESLGCRVDAIDHTPTNFNRLEGARALREALHSKVEIHDLDLDTQFALPRTQYGLVLFLGILYHLKNPYYALEKLSRSARYCLLSTRIARFAPDGHTNLEEIPVAYLLGHRETNNDPTNYWIFSDAGLRRILDRTGWTVLSFFRDGSGASDPVSPKADERAFCFLESRYSMRFGSECDLLLLQGWHPVEEGGWRWTGKRFSARLRTKDTALRTLRMSVAIPEAVLRDVAAVTLSAQVNGVALAPETFGSEGRHVYTRTLPESQTGDYLVEFEVDHAIQPTGADKRELGLVVASIGL